MIVELMGKPAFLSDIKYGDFFYGQMGDQVRPCIKAFVVENESDLIDYVVAFTPADRDPAELPRLYDNKALRSTSAYRISAPYFRHTVSDNTLLLKTEYWPKPGILIESSEASFLTIKSGRMAHNILYLNVGTGELVSSPPKAPFAFVTEWQILVQHGEKEQVLVNFPAFREMAVGF